MTMATEHHGGQCAMEAKTKKTKQNKKKNNAKLSIPAFVNDITKFRISGHNLNIERGRCENIDRNGRKCT